MSPLPASTDKILAYQEIPTILAEEMVEWAVEMFMLGYETPSLLILAGLSKPVYLSEAIPYLEKTCQEIGLSILTGEAAVDSYRIYFIKQLATAKRIDYNLLELHKLRQHYNDNSIFDFSLLFWAWDELKYGETYSDYWPDATPQNIENTVVETAKNWLKTYDSATNQKSSDHK